MNIFGPLWAGLIYDKVMMGAPYWMGAAVLVAAAVILLRSTTRELHANVAPEIIEEEIVHSV